MKARRFPKPTINHHNVYVVLLDPKAARNPRVRAANPNHDPAKPCIYVGMTGLDPRERFANHKNGHKAARIVQKYGIRLLHEFFEYLNPMPFEAAAQMEKDLAEDLRRQGYAVTGGT
jgi:predicted GIY-YIG superfamily endonuclease